MIATTRCTLRLFLLIDRLLERAYVCHMVMPQPLLFYCRFHDCGHSFLFSKICQTLHTFLITRHWIKVTVWVWTAQQMVIQHQPLPGQKFLTTVLCPSLWQSPVKRTRGCTDVLQTMVLEVPWRKMSLSLCIVSVGMLMSLIHSSNIYWLGGHFIIVYLTYFKVVI